MGGEIQLTDTIDLLAEGGRVGSVLLNCFRYDYDNKSGYLTATVDFALGRPEFRSRFRVFLEDTLKLALISVRAQTSYPCVVAAQI